MVITSWPMAAMARMGSSTEGCSTAEQMKRRLPRLSAAVPSSARLLPSVPPEVKYTSPAAPGRLLSMSRRSCFSLFSTSIAGRYMLDGLKYSLRIAAAMASTTWSKGRVVALLSRYANILSL